MKRRTDSTQLALLVLVCVVTAGTVLRTVRVAGRETGVKPASRVSASTRAHQPPPTQPPDPGTLRVVLERDPFQPAVNPRPVLAPRRPVGQAPPPRGTPPPPLPRVVTSDGTHAILSGADGDRMVWVGLTYGGFTVAGIDERRVTLEWKGKLFVLAAPVRR